MQEALSRLGVEATNYVAEPVEPVDDTAIIPEAAEDGGRMRCTCNVCI
jgi:hypothetical protein